jgi:Lysophospholipase
MEIQPPYTSARAPFVEFIEFNGANFKTVNWKVPETSVYKGKIVYVHGFAEDSSLYVEFFDKLSTTGYEIFFFDQRGAGETSPGSLVGKTDEHHVFNDLDFMIKHTLDTRTDESEKIFLAGHSMGSGIILNYGIRGKYKDNVKGIAAIGPLIRLHPKTEPNVVLRVLAPVISKLVPNLKIDSKLNIDYVTSNVAWQDYIRVHSAKLIGTTRQFHDMFTRGAALLDPEYVGKFNPEIAVFVAHGTDDNINWIKGSEEFVALLKPNVDKKFVKIEGGRHSLAIEKAEIFAKFWEELVGFLDKH